MSDNNNTVLSDARAALASCEKQQEWLVEMRKRGHAEAVSLMDSVRANTVNVAHLRAVLAEVDRLTRELEAYRKAKAENDERFMIERDEARRERDEARRMLGECYVLSGADTDGNDWPHLWPHAVRAVAQLRADYDETCAYDYDHDYRVREK